MQEDGCFEDLGEVAEPNTGVAVQTAEMLTQGRHRHRCRHCPFLHDDRRTMLLLQPLALLLAAVVPLVSVVRADTEIRNFALPLVDGRQMTIQQMPDMT